MEKAKKSGSAIFMYCVIALAIAVSGVCFTLYYTGRTDSTAILWTGIAFFTLMYHFWVRIILGNVTKLFPIHYSQVWFREHPFEKKLYRLLRVRKWKDRALTYNPELFSMKDRSLEQIAVTMAKVEVDHWVNELVSLSTLLFGVIWGKMWLFAATAVFAMLFDGQFICIQRYNRPRVLKALVREKRIAEKTIA
ncbi:MAG: hypothetical protein IJ452_05185 [Butyricicoccus sp.]|nr:hypothetical protein [Butyricicoccus sp.]